MLRFSVCAAPRGSRHVCVLVLGDLGRSPRMTYHATSLARNGFSLTLAGFRDTDPHRDVMKNPKIRIHPLSDFTVLKVGPRVLRYVLKVTVQAVQLFWELFKIEPPSFILLQNPPGLPAIAVTWFFCLLKRCQLIIDWHNYGYSIMSLTNGPRHPIVRIAKWYEKIFGRLSDYNLCVTNAMKEDLLLNWRIKAITLYDKPASIFRETPVELQHQLFMKLALDELPFKVRSGYREAHVEKSAFTEKNLTTGIVTSLKGRPALLISSTSWTEDEDFSVLLSALQ
ncbi:Chitobiosyldiphosphodolichol beta-mannosyltransferase, partial [Pristimantis euphronides]